METPKMDYTPVVTSAQTSVSDKMTDLINRRSQPRYRKWWWSDSERYDQIFKNMAEVRSTYSKHSQGNLSHKQLLEIIKLLARVKMSCTAYLWNRPGTRCSKVGNERQRLVKDIHKECQELQMQLIVQLERFGETGNRDNNTNDTSNSLLSYNYSSPILNESVPAASNPIEEDRKEIEKRDDFQDAPQGETLSSTFNEDTFYTGDYQCVRQERVTVFDEKFAMQEVIQGDFAGDCIFLATIASMANSGTVKNCFVREDSETVTIRFWWKNESFETRYVDITVKKTSPEGDDVATKFSRGASWVRFLEKAFAIYLALGYGKWCEKGREKAVDSDKPTYTNQLDSLDYRMCMFALTGQEAETITVPIPKGKELILENGVGIIKNGKKIDASERKFSGVYSTDRISLYNKISEELRKGNPITGGVPHVDNPKDQSKGDFLRKGLPGQHAYSIIGAYEKKFYGQTYKFIKVRNPYGVRSKIRVYDFESEEAKKRGRPIAKEVDFFGLKKYMLNGDITDEKLQSIGIKNATEIYEQGGISELELNDFCNCFRDITVLKTK